MPDKDVNINVVRTVWRRTKKGHIKVRDLQAKKDVKGGGGVAGIMKTSSSIAEAPLQNRLRAARDAMIRKLFEMPTERERKAREDAINKAHVRFLRWLRKSLRR
jgi:hypothetical protein